MIDPRTRLALLLYAGVLAISLERPGSLGLLAVVCASPLLLLRLPLVWWKRGLIAVLAIVWSTTLSQGLFYAVQPRVPALTLGPLTLWREGLLWGLAQSLRFVGLSLAGLALAASTPPDRLHLAMLALRVPFGLALMASTAVRFLPEIGRELLVVRRARAARGRPVWQRPPWQWLALEVSLLRPVVARSWRRAHSLAESLDARGFQALSTRSARQPLRMGGLDWTVLVVGALVSGWVASARVAYLLYTSDALYLPALRPLYAFVRAWL